MEKTVYLIGVCGTGKTTIGSKLSKALGRTFADGDNFHPESNRKKMALGTPLTDSDRLPWLQHINSYCKANPSHIVACSGLKLSYREILRKDLNCCFISLEVERGELEQRMARRSGHFMPASLLDSQLKTWEIPNEKENDVIRLDCTNLSIEQVIENICKLV